MYKDELDKLFNGDIEFLLEYKHVAYADDHLTIVILSIPLEWSAETVRDITTETALSCRNLLDLATRALGCGINRKKSEVLLPSEWSNAEISSNDEFVWLGYSLQLTASCKLIFTESKMRARFIRTTTMVRSIFQYIRSIFVRWRVYKVYVAPIIEWYLPCIFHKPMHDLSSSNAVRSFQHQMLCLVTGACCTTSTVKLAELLNEPPVRFKMGRLANRLKDHMSHRCRLRLWGIDSWDTANGGIVLRSQRETTTRPWAGVDKRDFGDAIFMLGESFADNKEGPKKYLRKKGNSVNKYRLEFDVQKVRTWVRINNADISRKMRERMLNDEG